MVQRLPKISDNPPAMEKDTEDAIAHPPTSHVIFAGSPRSVPMGMMMAVTKANPHEIGLMYDSASALEYEISHSFTHKGNED